MKKIKIVAIKELSFYLNNYIGYILAPLFSSLTLFLFLNNFFLINILSLSSFFEIIVWSVLILIAGISMRSFAEERKNNTLELWLTLPIGEIDLVLGKFLGLFLYLVICLSLTLPIVIGLFLLGTPYLPEIITAYLGLLMYSANYLSLGIFISLQTKNQIIALLITLSVCFILNMLGNNIVIRYLPQNLSQIVGYFSPINQLESFLHGLVTLQSIIFFLTSTFLWLIFSTIILIKRK